MPIYDPVTKNISLVYGDTYEDSAYDLGKISIPISTDDFILTGGDVVEVSFSTTPTSYVAAFTVTGTVVNAGGASQAVEFIINLSNAVLLPRPEPVPRSNEPKLSGWWDIQLLRDTDNKTTLITGNYYLSRSLTA